jgi:glycosyltransferase involved in cell wall biosynthesis
MHDLHLGVDVSPQVAERIDHVAVLSVFHAMALARFHTILFPKRLTIGNGIDPHRYDGIIEKVPMRFFYSSDPMRGLETLVDEWDKVRAQIPNAELNVACDFDLSAKIAEAHVGKAGAIRVKQLRGRIQQTSGIVYHRRLNQGDLAKLQMSCVGWVYPPNGFLETFCITALEAQAARCVPITRLNGALPEVIRHSIEWQEGAELAELIVDKMSLFEGTKIEENYDNALSRTWRSKAIEWINALCSGGARREKQHQGMDASPDCEVGN